MKQPRPVKLDYGERIVGVNPIMHHGKTVVWVYIATNNGRYREVCIYPHEQTPLLRVVFAVGAVLVRALIRAVPVTTR